VHSSSPPPPFTAPCLILGSSGSSAALGFSGPGHSFDFFKDADSNVAPPPYLGTAVGAGYETVICRMVWDDEFIAAALRASEGSLWHGACRPFWLAHANRLVSPAWVARLCARTDGSQAGCAEAVRSLAFADALTEMPRRARQLAADV